MDFKKMMNVSARHLIQHVQKSAKGLLFVLQIGGLHLSMCIEINDEVHRLQFKQ